MRTKLYRKTGRPELVTGDGGRDALFSMLRFERDARLRVPDADLPDGCAYEVSRGRMVLVRISIDRAVRDIVRLKLRFPLEALTRSAPAHRWTVARSFRPVREDTKTEDKHDRDHCGDRQRASTS